jgi:hypothetical protein
LEGDYAVLMMTQKGVNDEGARPRLQHFFTLAKKWGAVNLGDGKRHTVFVLGYDDMYEGMQDHGVSQAVFTDPKSLAGFLKDLNEADLGVSTVVAGLFDVTASCCREAGLTPHTYEYSGGVWGRTERLPGEDQLALMTMCGHGMVPGGLVDHLVGEMRRGRITAQEAAMRMTKLCICGVVNPERAAGLLAAMAQ